MFLISTKGKNTSDIWICIYIYESALIAIYVKKSPLLDFNIICKPCCPSSFKLGRAGSVSWHQHLCSTSGQFSDNCYQVSARINSFWISLIRSVAAISPETYLGALEMIPTATTTSTAHYYCIWEAQVDHWQSPSCPHPTRIAAEWREAVAKTSLQSLLEVSVVIVKVNAWPRCKRANTRWEARCF